MRMANCFLDRLRVKNFRNLADEIISFDAGINCIFGENGNGKTNLLEAIYMITEKKSFRKNTRFPQMVSINGEEPEFLFQSKFRDEEDKDHVYSGKVDIEKGEYFLNGKLTKKKLGINSIFINPFDSLHFHSTPSFRRQWFDRNISIADEAYRKTLQRYRQALKMRNNLLLKRPSLYLKQIAAIDGEMAKYTLFLAQKRANFVSEIEQLFSPTFRQLFDDDCRMEIKIKSKFASLELEQILDATSRNMEKDLLAGKTTSGIHHDDYMLLFDGLNAYEICSLGQQKMAFLSLSFAYIELFQYKFRTYPIVLIDDVSGELDRKRWGHLIRYICAKKFQTFITTANEDFKREFEQIEKAKKLQIHQGRVKVH